MNKIPSYKYCACAIAGSKKKNFFFFCHCMYESSCLKITGHHVFTPSENRLLVAFLVRLKVYL